MIEFFFGDADDLRAFSYFLEPHFDLVLDPSAVDQAVSLLLGQFQEVHFGGPLQFVVEANQFTATTERTQNDEGAPKPATVALLN